jgi:hypothetical protein
MSVFRRVLQQRDAFRAAFWRGLWRHDSGVPTDHTKEVLNALRAFCRADTSCVQFDKQGRIDTHSTAVCEGRREVWLEILRVLNLSDAELLAIQGREDHD